MRALAMLLVLVLMLAVIAVGGWLIIELIPGWADRGAFGSMFGPIQAILSGIAIVGVVYTIFLQQEALRIQNAGLAETRRELTHATEMQEQSLQVLREQVEALRETVRTSSLSVLLPILQQRIASIPEPARNSEAFQRLVERTEQLEEYLTSIAFSDEGTDVARRQQTELSE